MYEYLFGNLVSINTQKAVLDINGIGYLLYIPISVFSANPKLNTKIKFFISPIVREDSYKNYGFLCANERNFFEKVRQVSGIGAKTALSLVGHLDQSTLRSALQSGNSALLSKIPGIGKKTSERLVVELRDKTFTKTRAKKNDAPIETDKLSAKDLRINDATNAMIHLGYSPLQAQKCVDAASTELGEEIDLSILIKKSLSMGK